MERHEIKILLNYLQNNPKQLNSLQHEFIVSLAKHYKTTRVLTKREVECLSDMKNYVPALSREEAANESKSEKYQAQYSSLNYLIPYNF